MSQRRARALRRAQRCALAPSGAEQVEPVWCWCACSVPDWSTPWMTWEALGQVLDVVCAGCGLPAPVEVGGGRAASGASPAAGGPPGSSCVQLVALEGSPES